MSVEGSKEHPIVIVTGANSGVGLGACQRLIEHLAQPVPPDSLLKPIKGTYDLSSSLTGVKNLTLILACRNQGRADKALKLLWDALDKKISLLKADSDYNGHADEFRKNLTIDSIRLDLTSMESVFSFAEEVNRRYPYVSHLVMNAGLIPLTSIDYLQAIRDILINPSHAVTQPRFIRQGVGLESSDGIGLVFQSNVLGHFSLFRELEPLLRKNPSGDSRIQWLSSMDSTASDYDPSDIQLLRGDHPYEASKFQGDLVCTALAHQSLSTPRLEGEAHIQHSLITPGICHTANTGQVLNVVLEWCKVAAFYLARLFGSQNHPISPYQGAVAIVYGILAPLTILQATTGATNTKLTSKATLFGESYVGTVPVYHWEEYEDHATALVEYCDDLLDKFRRVKGPSRPQVTDSGIDINS